MTPEEMGRVHAFLQTHRLVETNPLHRRRVDDEAEVAAILTANDLRLDAYQQFLKPLGLTLVELDQLHLGAQIPGRIYVLARRGDGPAPTFLGPAWIWQEMADGRRKDTIETVVVWTAQLWAMMNWFFYTDRRRTVDQVSGYRDAVVSASAVTDAMWQHIESLRQAGPPSEGPRTPYEILTEASRIEVESRGRRFLSVMEQAGAIERVEGEDIFRQSIVSAVEMRLNFERNAAHLLPPSERGGGVLDLLRGYVPEADRVGD